MSARIHDAAVLGAGPAGLTGSFFLARHGRSVLLVDDLLGNHLTNAGIVENFPGFPGGIAGPDLWALLQQQSLDSGVEFFPARAEHIDQDEHVFRITTSMGERRARCVLVCVGSALRRLAVEGEDELDGRGLSHCATCDGPLFRARDVAVVGGGDAALDSALFLSTVASTVTIIHRGPNLGGQRVLRDRIAATTNVRVLLRTQVVRMEGRQALENLVLRDSASGSEFRQEVAGVFVLAGLEPNTRFLSDTVELDAAGHVVTDPWLAASVPGVFAAGDIRVGSARQFAAAAGDGVTAAIAAHRFLELRN